MRLTVAVTVAYFSILGLALADDAHASIRKPINIPAQPLSLALQSLARDRHLQVVYVSEEVNSLRTQGAVGELNTEEALQEILKGTGLTYRYLNQRTVTIKPIGPGASQGRDRTSEVSQESTAEDLSQEENQKQSLWDRFRLAQVDQGAPASTASIARPARPDSDQNSVRLEEVVVTAQKREERLIDVPISIVAITGDELQKRRVNTLDDLPAAVPGLSVTNAGSGRLIFLRGVSNSVGTPLVGMYLDEADVTLGGGQNSPAVNPSTYDLQRVEVLRGPQGTLYGEGSAGGTIRFITNEPALSKFDFGADVAALFTQNGAPSQRINSMVNVPLVDGKLGLRVAGTFDHEGGWIDQPTADLTEINARNLTNVRIKGLWKPASQLTVNAMAVINRDDRGLDITDLGSRRNFTQVLNLMTTPRQRQDYDLYNLTITYDSGFARLISATSDVRSNIPIRDQSESLQLGPPGTPDSKFAYYVPVQTNIDDVFTQELRLTSNSSENWQWTLGGFYRDYRNANTIPAEYFALPGSPGTPLSAYGSFSYNTSTSFRSWSGFGNTSYTLWGHLTVGAGVRYFQDRQIDTDYTQIPTTVERAEFDSTDPRFYAQYKLDNNLNIYASASKGFRSGGFNFSAANPTYGPESLWTYELGAKMSLPNSRVSADAAVFWTNYAGYQTVGITAGTQNGFISNAGGARVKGVEWDFTWRPTDQWVLSFNGDYLDTRFTQDSANYNVGDPLDLSPKYQVTMSGERDFTLNGKRGSVRLDYSQQGRETYRFRSYGPWFFYESDVIDLLNVNASIQWNENLTLGMFVQNLLNDQGFVSPVWGIGNGIRPRPRTFGVEFGARL